MTHLPIYRPNFEGGNNALLEVEIEIDETKIHWIPDNEVPLHYKNLAPPHASLEAVNEWIDQVGAERISMEELENL